MSWDFSMAVPIAADGGLVSLSGYDANYTYNVHRMFVYALGHADGIRSLNKRTGRECLPLLDAAIADMRANRGHYETLNPENGWGSADGARELLETLASWCREVPGAVLWVR